MASSSEVHVKLTADTSQFRREMRRLRRASRRTVEVDDYLFALLFLILANTSDGWASVMWTALGLLYLATYFVRLGAAWTARRAEKRKS